MTQMKDVPVQDIIGILSVVQGYITNQLGFDYHSIANVEYKHTGDGKLEVYGFDKFQNGVHYTEKVGELTNHVYFKPDSNWEEIQKELWETLENCMCRDERELRFGAQQLSKMIENFSLETEIGKMLHQRLIKIRDEMTGNLLTIQKSKSSNPEFPPEEEK